MDDERIIELFCSRNENAVKETELKFGNYCRRIAKNILKNEQDSEECVNDTLLKVWDSVPPEHPENLKIYVGRIARNLALNKYNFNNAKKRSGDKRKVAFEELEDYFENSATVESVIDNEELICAINKFLFELPQETRIVFMQRYWYFNSISQISENCGYLKSNVKMKLLRARKKLKDVLEKEGIEL